jgi:hypothetical protein
MSIQQPSVSYTYLDYNDPYPMKEPTDRSLRGLFNPKTITDIYNNPSYSVCYKDCAPRCFESRRVVEARKNDCKQYFQTPFTKAEREYIANNNVKCKKPDSCTQEELDRIQQKRDLRLHNVWKKRYENVSVYPCNEGRKWTNEEADKRYDALGRIYDERE